MKLKLISDFDNSSDGGLGAIIDLLGPVGLAGDLNANAPVVANAPEAASPLDTSGPVIPEVPVLTAEAAQASGAQSGAVTALSMTSGGITINLLFDAAAMAAPASFRAGIQQAASLLTAAVSDQITVNIKIDYSGTGGGAAAGPDSGQYLSYSTVRSDLISHATAGDTTFNALPNGSSFQGQTNVAVWNAQLKLWGILSPNDTTTDDGSATFATDIDPSLLVGVALHELTHAMGRVPYGPPYDSSPDILDLSRFTSTGVRLIDGAGTAPPAYFSTDGGTTKIADYGQTSDASDFLNSGVQGGNDPFNEFYSGGTLQSLTTVDKEQLDALGFHTSPRGFGITATSSQAVQGGAAVTLLSGPPTITDAASALSSATITITNASGSAVAGDELFINGQQSGTVDSGLVSVSWNNTTKTLTLTGSASIGVYEALLSQVSYQDTGTDSSSGTHPLRTIAWSVNDDTGNFGVTSQVAVERAPAATVANLVLNPSATTVAASSLLHASDPDGDAIATYAFRDTGSGHFVLNGVVEANNQEIDVSSAQLSQLVYQTAGATDSLQVRVSDGTLWSAWQSFTVMGPAPTTVEAFGSTSLVEIGFNYYLYSKSSGWGPELTDAGAAVVAGPAGSWTPIAVEQVAGGYDVAWKIPGGNEYIIWETDGAGNYTGTIADVYGTSATLESYETIFQQDLNGDGTIGLAPTTIEASGSTSLVELGSNFYMNSIGAGTGPELKFAGTPVVAGPAGSWTPIGAEQVTGGYDVAWKIPGGNEYIIWNTDSSGNYEATIADVSGTSAALESYETTFQQDLNGDGIIGLPPPRTIEAQGSTSLVEAGNNFYLDSIATGTGPELKHAGVAVVAAPAGGWSPIGAEQVAGGGFDVVWTVTGSNEFIVWATDSSGNYTGTIADVYGTSATLQTYETIFHQDLNGDGTIGLAPTTIEASGSTSLIESGSNFYMNSIGAGTGPELKFAGTPVVAGPAGSWTPIGAEQVAGGYDVAWKVPGGNEYIIWNTDSSGNYEATIADVSGTSAVLQSYETIFHQDLNGDGIIGAPSSTGPVSGQSAGVPSHQDFFDGTTLTLDTPSAFSGQIIGFSGDGTIAGSDRIDLSTIEFSSIQSSFDASTGALAVSDGTSAANLHFLGQYSVDNFRFADDGSGGTLVYASTSAQPASIVQGEQPLSPSVAQPTDPSGHDTFVFAPNFGQATIANFTPAADTIQFSKTIFADVNAVLAAIHDDSFGDAVITDAAHDTITVQHVTTAELLAHQDIFKIV